MTGGQWGAATRHPCGGTTRSVSVCSGGAPLPAITDAVLFDATTVPGYAGIRPKINAPHEPARDFVIQGPADHGVAGLVNLFGIESPGLTSSLAIGERVAGLLA